MQTDFIAVPPFWSVGQTIDYMRDAEDLPDRFYEVFVVDPSFHLMGSVALDRLLRSKLPVNVEEITDRDIHPIDVTSDQEEGARTFERYNLTSAPVVDPDQRLVGMITADDVVEVIQEEASEDILRLGGVAGESVSIRSGRPPSTASSGCSSISHGDPCLLGHQPVRRHHRADGGACRAHADSSVDGRNAGTQTMTVAVRALATQDLGAVNAARVIGRETVVGLPTGSCSR